MREPPHGPGTAPEHGKKCQAPCCGAEAHAWWVVRMRTGGTPCRPPARPAGPDAPARAPPRLLSLSQRQLLARAGSRPPRLPRQSRCPNWVCGQQPPGSATQCLQCVVQHRRCSMHLRPRACTCIIYHAAKGMRKHHATCSPMHVKTQRSAPTEAAAAAAAAVALAAGCLRAGVRAATALLPLARALLLPAHLHPLLLLLLPQQARVLLGCCCVHLALLSQACCSAGMVSQNTKASPHQLEAILLATSISAADNRAACSIVWHWEHMTKEAGACA